MRVIAGFTEVQAFGLVALCVGLFVMVKCRRVAEINNTIDRAQADFVEPLVPRQVRGIWSVWARSGTDDTPGWRFLRAYIAFVFGLGLALAGAAALLGAWDEL